MANGYAEISVACEDIVLMPHRAAFWPRASTLLLADLHLGKGETLAAAGAPIPPGITAADLHRLSDAVRLTAATRVLILGDLLHAPIGIVPAMVDQVAAWRRTLHAELWLVPGNHDRRIDRVADAWNIHICHPRHDEGPFTFVHDADAAAADTRYTWAGHVHPRITLRGGGDSLSLPCFVIGDRAATLPAFSRFTAGAGVSLCSTQRAWAIAENTLVELPGPRLPSRRSSPRPVRNRDQIRLS